MRYIWLTFAAVVLVVVVRMSVFTVDPTEFVYVTQFGAPVAVYDGARAAWGGGGGVRAAPGGGGGRGGVGGPGAGDEGGAAGVGERRRPFNAPGQARTSTAGRSKGGGRSKGAYDDAGEEERGEGGSP